LGQLNHADRQRVSEALVQTYEQLRHNRRALFAKLQRPLTIHLKNGLSPSLYSLRVGRDIRVILTIDDDPIFARMLVTLFRVVRRDELAQAYRSTANILYRGSIETRNGTR
jgi:hypothetical protein